MKRLLLIIILQNFFTGNICSQSFSVNDLVKLASLPSKDIDHFMNKNGYIITGSKSGNESMEASFSIKMKKNKTYPGPKRTITIYLQDDSTYFILHTSSLNEYLDGQRSLIKSDFFHDDKKDISKDSSVLFQKGNITIRATMENRDSVPQYAFELRQKKLPHTVKYAEDLLQFDSHEFLVSFFGGQNVKKDIYYFSEKELKKCSVLFSGTRYQVVFVWGDENNLNDLLYILVPHSLPTAGADKKNPVTGNNEWQFQNGIYPGMDLKELLRLNEMDFKIYGNASELAFMVKPSKNGKIDFRKTAVMLSCDNCDDIKMFNQPEVSALAVAKKDLPMYVTDVIIYPSHH
jgi:hypothetical protein